MTAGIGASFVTAMLANPSVACGSTVIEPGDPIALSDGGNGDKPKMQRAGDGTLIVAYGDSPAGAPLVYDVKADLERPARDIFVKTCKPSATKSCCPPGWTGC